jgi:hypothetical protein
MRVSRNKLATVISAVNFFYGAVEAISRDGVCGMKRRGWMRLLGRVPMPTALEMGETQYFHPGECPSRSYY